MTYTTNTHMKKPGYSDTADIQDINDNFDTIDKHIGAKVSSDTGTHGIRFNAQDEKLQVYDETYDEWVDATGEYAGQVPPPSSILNDNSWETIHKFSATGANYWNVGDCKSVLVNGTIGTLSVNQTFWVYILGFNHNEAIEGKGIHFGCFKTAQADGTDICLCDGSYNSSGSSNAFRVSTSNANAGGWAGSYMRNTICSAFLSSLPSECRDVIIPCTKYSDNTGGGKNEVSYVTSTSDNIWLLSEFEIYGTRTYANSAEQNYQAQYDYYKNGNMKTRYKHSEIGTSCNWWTRSVTAPGNSTRVCMVGGDGTVFFFSSNYSLGFAPGFKV